MTASPTQIVTEFLQRIERLDVASAGELLASDAEYDNVPIGKILGREAIIGALEGWLGTATSCDWKVFRQIESGRTVMNERLDRIEMAGKWVEIPCAGIFEIDAAGQIALWRDYFDLPTFTNQMADASG